MRHRLRGISNYGLNGQKKGEDRLAYTPVDILLARKQTNKRR